MSSAASPRRGLGRGFEVLIGGAEPELAHLPVDQIHPNPQQPRKRFDGEASAGLAESIRAQGADPAGRRAAAARGRLRADRRRAPLARRARGRHRRPCRRSIREADDRDTLLLGLVENVAREDLSPIEEARALRDAARRVRPLARRGRRARRPVEAGGLEPRPAARAARGRARDGRPRRADRGPRPRGARRARPRRPPQARAADRPRGPLGARRRARGALGGRPDEGAQGDVGRPGRRGADQGGGHGR